MEEAMQQKLEKNEDHDYCPNCDMPLEDSEACNYCEWTSINGQIIKGKENEKSTN